MHIPFSVSMYDTPEPAPGNSLLAKLSSSAGGLLSSRLDGENQSVFPYLCVWGLRISFSLIKTYKDMPPPQLLEQLARHRKWEDLKTCLVRFN